MTARTMTMRKTMTTAATTVGALLFILLLTPSSSGVAATTIPSAAASADEHDGDTDDRITDLPGYGTPPSPQFSGFLNASDSTDGTYLHYWLVHRHDPADDPSDYSDDDAAALFSDQDVPLVLWLNGGPGSSSILGMLTEQGPLLVRDGVSSRDDEKLFFENPYAWTTRAHLLILESPAGVGYSFCSKPEACSNTDKSTARDARAALQDFFATKFPQLANNPFYITGESYAGVYVPTLAREILDNAPEINLVGLAVGDPCTDNESQREAFDMLWYGHKYGFVPDEEYELLHGKCGVRMSHPLTSGRWYGAAAKTKAEQASVVKAGDAGTTMLREMTDAALEELQSRRRRLRQRHSPSSSFSSAKDDDDEKECLLALRKFTIQTSSKFSQSWQHRWINDYALYSPSEISEDPTSLDYALAEYMNRDDVKRALHVTKSPNGNWTGGPYGDGWSYESDYAACNDDAKPDAPSMIDFYRYLAPKLRGKIIVYNGDADPCVTYEGTRRAIGRVGYDVVDGGGYRPWFFHWSSVPGDGGETLAERPSLFGPSLSVYDEGPQYGGHVVDYEHGLSFVTVHGSGHMVPQVRPRAALRILDALLLEGVELAPRLKSDEELAGMDPDVFSGYMDEWTDGAKRSAMMTTVV